MSNSSILVVEDNPIVAMVVEDEVAEAGFKLAGTAATQARGYELASRRRPSLALIDIDLDTPEAGIALARRIMSDFAIPTIFVSGQASIAHQNRDAAIAFIEKPIREQVFARDLAIFRARLTGEDEAGELSDAVAVFE